jgi:hypothetical protein
LLYDVAMGYSASVVEGPGRAPWSVLLRVSLTRAESNDLFLSGDSMVSWPVEGLQSSAYEESKLERSSMFVSEVAARQDGLVISYGEQSQAERTAAILRIQFAQIGIKEET